MLLDTIDEFYMNKENPGDVSQHLGAGSFGAPGAVGEGSPNARQAAAATTASSGSPAISGSAPGGPPDGPLLAAARLNDYDAAIKFKPVRLTLPLLAICFQTQFQIVPCFSVILSSLGPIAINERRILNVVSNAREIELAMFELANDRNIYRTQKDRQANGNLQHRADGGAEATAGGSGAKHTLLLKHAHTTRPQRNWSSSFSEFKTGAMATVDLSALISYSTGVSCANGLLWILVKSDSETKFGKERFG
ncbi:unnamed protein product [Angiostrongylus costaricensis]|uniref:Uncharacterized protein n=1 Tax=Angiostrongylus costaricensis TaxID=334426 RepID=A0A0R3PEN9_ANGCS|nr:unnamed protein product [Angiostrongylus costaricensis]